MTLRQFTFTFKFTLFITIETLPKILYSYTEKKFAINARSNYKSNLPGLEAEMMYSFKIGIRIR